MSENLIPVVKIQLVGFHGPLVLEDVDRVAEEVRSLLCCGPTEGKIDMETGDKIVLTVDRMTRTELDALPEFGGY